MSEFKFNSSTFSNISDVLLLFSIPIGGGIPAGVLLAKSRGFSWIFTTLIYFISDVLLALYFEPLMMIFNLLCKKHEFLARFRDLVKKSTNRTIAGYGSSPGPFLLVVIAFGVDPMTGRAAALAAGHGFLAGWAVAILGDMIFFGVVAVSTLCLNNILGDGTWTAVIIMFAMMGIPAVVRRFKPQQGNLK